jgi:riboflavin biosynthesis pyrimidine reductase
MSQLSAETFLTVGHEMIQNLGMPMAILLPLALLSALVTLALLWPGGRGAGVLVDGSPSLVRSLFRLGLVDRVRVMVFPTIRGETGEGPVFADLPDLDLNLTDTRVIDERLVLLDYRVASTRW